MVKNLPAVQEMRVQSVELNQDLQDALEKEMAAHSSFLLEDPMDREAWQATVMES